MIAALHLLALAVAAVAVVATLGTLIHVLCRQEDADVADLRRRIALLESIIDPDLDPTLDPEDTTP